MDAKRTENSQSLSGNKRRSCAESKLEKDSTTSRRQKENQTYVEMADSIPLDKQDTKDLDRVSVLRVAISYIKCRNSMSENGNQNGNMALVSSKHKKKELVPKFLRGMQTFLKETLKAMDGFVLVVSPIGEIIYASTNISEHIGLRQVDVIGQALQDLVHPQDFNEMAHIFTGERPVKPDLEEEMLQSKQKHFVVRMRSTFSSSVRSLTRCASFKPIYCAANITYRENSLPINPYQKELARVTIACRVAGLVDVHDLCLGVCVTSRCDLNYQCHGVDNKMRIILGYDPSDMMSSNAFAFFHPGDLSPEHIMNAHQQLVETGSSKSPAFRVMTKWGNWVWTRALKECTYDPVTHKPNGMVIYLWLVGPDNAIECNRAFINHYGSNHLPNTHSQIQSVYGDGFDTQGIIDNRYVPLYQPGTTPPHLVKVEPVIKHQEVNPSCNVPPPDDLTPSCIIDHHGNSAADYLNDLLTSPPITPPEAALPMTNGHLNSGYVTQGSGQNFSSVMTPPMSGTPISSPPTSHTISYVPSVSQGVPSQTPYPVEGVVMTHTYTQPHYHQTQVLVDHSLAPPTKNIDPFPIGYMTPSPSESDTKSFTSLSPQNRNQNLDGFCQVSIGSRSSLGSTHLTQGKNPRGSLDDEGYLTDSVFDSPTGMNGHSMVSIHGCHPLTQEQGLPHQYPVRSQPLPGVVPCQPHN